MRESGHRNESLCPRNTLRAGRHIGFLSTHFRPRDQVAKNLYSPQLRPYNDIGWGQARQWGKRQKTGPNRKKYLIATCNFYFSVSDYIYLLLLQTISCQV